MTQDLDVSRQRSYTERSTGRPVDLERWRARVRSAGCPPRTLWDPQSQGVLVNRKCLVVQTRSRSVSPPSAAPSSVHSTGTQLSLSRGGDWSALSGCRLWLLPAPSRGLAHQARANVRPRPTAALGTPAAQIRPVWAVFCRPYDLPAMALRRDVVVGAPGSAGVFRTQYVDLPGAAAARLRPHARAACASPTRRTASWRPASDNVILVCHALSGDAHAAGWSDDPDAPSAVDGFGADERGIAPARRAGLVGRHDRPRQGVRHRPLLRHLHQSDRLLPRLDRPELAQSRPPASRTAWTSRSSPSATWCAPNERLLERARHRLAAGRRRRLAGRHAGARVGRRLSRRRARVHLHRQHRAPGQPGHGLERDRPQRDHGRSRLAGRRLLRHRPRADRRHRRRAHGRPRHLPVGGVDAREVRPPPAGSRATTRSR